MTLWNPYHEGELAMQARAGALEAAHQAATRIHDRLPANALPYIAQQEMAIFGSLVTHGEVWASVLFGHAGFLTVRDTQTLDLQRNACHTASGDPFWQNLDQDPRLGILLIELHSRRRLRINGRVRGITGNEYCIGVERAYANCPRYIQRRHLIPPAPGGTAPVSAHRTGQDLDAVQQTWIGHADTCFVASAHPTQGADASHRGGQPGFITVLSPQRLRIPDFAGNNMFNTLGNFISYPHAGLTFIEFERLRLLQLTGVPVLLENEPDPPAKTGGPARHWEFEITSWRESDLPSSLQWHPLV